MAHGAEVPYWIYKPQMEKKELVLVTGQNFKDAIVTKRADGTWRGSGLYEREEAGLKVPIEIRISYEKKLSEKHGAVRVVVEFKDEKYGKLDKFDLTFRERGLPRRWKLETPHETPLGEAVKTPEWERMLKGFLEYDTAGEWLKMRKKELLDGKIISEGLRRE